MDDIIEGEHIRLRQVKQLSKCTPLMFKYSNSEWSFPTDHKTYNIYIKMDAEYGYMYMLNVAMCNLQSCLTMGLSKINITLAAFCVWGDAPIIT